MRALLLNAEICRAIDAAVDAARATPVSWETFKTMIGSIDQNTVSVALKDRPPNFKRPPAHHVLIPVGFRAAISFEDQPAGLVRHLSISVESNAAGAIPNIPSILAVAKAFGFILPEGLESIDRVWTEEYEPGKWAVNLLQLDHEREAPTERRQ
jgi:hypothetical protein